MLTPPEYLSPSSLSTFKQCPLRFKYTKIDGLREPDTEATVLGSFVHEVLECLFGLPPVDRSIEIAKALATDAWNNGGWREKVASVIGLRDDLLREFRWKAWWCIENYFSMEKPEEINLAGIEDEVTGRIAGVPIRGFIDRWSYDENSQIHISDYKTGKTPGVRYREDKFTQLFIYAALLEQRLESRPKQVELLYLKSGDRLVADVTDEAIAGVESLIKSVNDQILDRCEVGKFEYKTSRLCDWCSFKPTCPAWGRK